MNKEATGTPIDKYVGPERRKLQQQGLFYRDVDGRVARQVYDGRHPNTKPPRAEAVESIPMLLFCPRCNFQHVDAPEPESGWTNPPHATHTCKSCGLNWRPSNALTVGVAEIECLETKHAERIAASRPKSDPTAEQERDALKVELWEANKDFDNVQRLCDEYGADLQKRDARIEAAEQRVGMLEKGFTVDAIIAAMREMSPQARMNIGQGWFCRGCGTLDLPCHCENDE